MGVYYDGELVGFENSDLIDVTELPTAEIDDDKVYRISGLCELYVSFVGSFGETQFNTIETLLANLGFTDYHEILVESIDEVTEPQITNFPTVYMYIDKSTGIGYASPDGTLIDAARMLNELLEDQIGGVITLTNKGLITDISEITEDGVYFLYNENTTIIGIPNIGDNKLIYTHDGTSWVQLNKN